MHVFLKWTWAGALSCRLPRKAGNQWNRRDYPPTSQVLVWNSAPENLASPGTCLPCADTSTDKLFRLVLDVSGIAGDTAEKAIGR